MSPEVSIPAAKNYRKHIYFVFRLDKLALLGSKGSLMNIQRFCNIAGL